MPSSGRPFPHFISILMLAGLISAFVVPVQTLNSFAQETGSLKVTVNHANGTPADPEDYYVTSDENEKYGYFSLNDVDGNIIDVLPTCNESAGSCEIGGLAPGTYTITIALSGTYLIVGGSSEEYSQEVDIDEGSLSEVDMTVDYGLLEIDVTHLDGQEIDDSRYVSEYGFVEGYYSIYNSDDDFVADAPSCNLEDSCSLALPSGIYTARVVSPASLNPYSAVFEIEDNTLTHESIQVEMGEFAVTVLDGDGQPADPSRFIHPIGHGESGHYAVYDASGYLILDGESCNIVDDCTYLYDAGTYQVSIRRLPSQQLVSCIFEINDNGMTPVKLYLDPPGCNQIPVDDPGDDGGDNIPPDAGSSGGNNNSNPGSNNSNGTNSGSDGTKVPSTLIGNSLKGRTVSVVSSSHFIDQDGFYHLVGEVANTQTIPANKITITGLFYDNGTRNILAIQKTETFVDLLRPNGRSPFEFVMQSVGVSDKISNYTLFAVFKNSTSTVKPGSLGMQIENSAYSNETGLYNIHGTIYNYAKSAAHFVKVVVSAYDGDGRIVHVVQKYVTMNLPETSSADFDISFLPANASRIVSVSTVVQSKEYDMVPAAKFSSPLTLEINYEKGVISVNGTIPNFSPENKYALLYIVWPDGFGYDKETVVISSQGYYEKTVLFYASDELKDQIFTVKVVYGGNFAEKEFIYA